MDQIIVNIPQKMPASNIIPAPLDNSISTETLVNRIRIQILDNNIKSDPSKYIENLQPQT